MNLSYPHDRAKTPAKKQANNKKTLAFLNNAAYPDDYRAGLTYAYVLDVESDQVFTASDGYRLALDWNPYIHPTPEPEIPPDDQGDSDEDEKTFDYLRLKKSSEQEPPTLAIHRRLSTGFDSFLVKPVRVRLQVDIAPFRRALKQCEVFARDNALSTKIWFNPAQDVLGLTARSQERGDIESLIPVHPLQNHHAPIEVSLNCRYLLDALAPYEETDTIEFCILSPTLETQNFLFAVGNWGDRFTFIMPLSKHWQDETGDSFLTHGTARTLTPQAIDVTRKPFQKAKVNKRKSTKYPYTHASRHGYGIPPATYDPDRPKIKVPKLSEIPKQGLYRFPSRQFPARKYRCWREDLHRYVYYTYLEALELGKQIKEIPTASVVDPYRYRQHRLPTAAD